jgi:sugar fermentation stimulation protein A
VPPPAAAAGGRLTSIALPGPLVETRFVGRPNRFLLRCEAPTARLREVPPAYAARDAPPCPPGAADLVEAHMADPGRLRELLLPGKRVWLRPAEPSSTRRTRWSAVLVESPDGRGLVSVDTTLPNRLVHAALLEGTLAEFDGWTLERREAMLGRSRIDFVLARGDGRRLALEVKSVTLVEDGVALFPDAVTARGARHVRELTAIAAQPGWEAAVLFVLQRPDAARIVAASSIDPAFAAALEAARRGGVRLLGRRCEVTLERVMLGEAVPAAAT